MVLYGINGMMIWDVIMTKTGSINVGFIPFAVTFLSALVL
jgi:hypothetical protein